jgi:DNA-3-methyladenine glycosylase I
MLRGKPCGFPREQATDIAMAAPLKTSSQKKTPAKTLLTIPPDTDGLVRCSWPGEDPLYVAYHDEEWGVPEFDDRALYEKLMLDGFQAGLSWITILRKRDNFRRAFDGFEPQKIARYSPKKIETLMQDAGIVRNRAKIEGAVKSAQAYLNIMEKGPGFSQLLWDFTGGQPKVNRFRGKAQVPTETPLSQAMSKELAARGFKFVGPTIVYAFMQAVGMVNDHFVTCHRHAACAALGKPHGPKV